MPNLALEILPLDKSENKQVIVKIVGSLLQSTLTSDFAFSIDSAQRKQVFSSSRVCVDFSLVERIDTAGLAWVLNMATAFIQGQTQFTFKNVPEQLLNLASLSNAKELLTEHSEP